MNETRRCAFITGSGRNIGRATALALAADGCDVVLNGSRDRAACEAVADEARALGVEALIAMGDVGSAEDVQRMVAEANRRFGGIDVMVNNAAIRPAHDFLSVPEADWQRIIDVDLNAAIRFSRAVLAGMLERGWGRIVNFTGMNSIRGYGDRAAISVAKHGVWGLTKALAVSYGGQGITVNAISPGPIAPDEAEPEMRRHIESQLARIPAGRLGRPDEVAAACALLASDRGAFINGQMIAVNGGAAT